MNSEITSTHFEVTWERVKQITGWSDYKDLAEFVDSTSQSISGVKKRGKFPLEWARKIAISFSSSTDYILDGGGDVIRSKTTYQMSDGLKNADITSELGEGFVQIPRYEVAASAGNGAIIHSEQIVDHLTFRADWVKNALGVPVSSLALINVKGDSMEPTLSNGDVILIDMTLDGFDDNAVYVLRLNGTLLVKRVKRNFDGSVLVSSDNAMYPPDTIKFDVIDTLNVVGRVVWCGRRM